MLGAEELYRLAGQAEAACLAGDVDGAARLTTLLAALLQRLHESAAAAFNAARVRTEEAGLASIGNLEPHALAHLVDLLRRQSLSAVARFNTLAPKLRLLLGKSTYDLVRGHMDNLEFNDAATVLAASRQ
jgi:hypothetical protein